MYSLNFLELISNINLFSTILIICIGLIGNTLSLIIYGQSKYRVNSSNVFILILSIIDSLFLIVHFFEDTITSLKKYDLSIHYYLNVIEINRESCMLINYFRYVLRSISSYVILAFTIQRFKVVYSPLSSKFKSKQYAWYTCLIIIIISFLMNLWSLFVFDLSKRRDVVKKCDIVEDWIDFYFYISIFYFTLNILIPMISVVILNFLIIYKTKKDNLKRTQYTTYGTRMRTNTTTLNSTRRNALSNLVDLNASIKQMKDKNLTKKMSKTLALASFSFVVLNLPYAITW
jgi:hypothetical protein